MRAVQGLTYSRLNIYTMKPWIFLEKKNPFFNPQTDELPSRVTILVKHSV